MIQPGTAQAVTLPRKTTVRYLGVLLDYTLKNKDHLDIQLKAASNAFKANSRIFYCKYLSVKAKIICYQLLVRHTHLRSTNMVEHQSYHDGKAYSFRKTMFKSLHGTIQVK